MSLFYKKCGCGATVHRSADVCPSCGKKKFKVPDIVSKGFSFVIIILAIAAFSAISGK